MYNYRPKNCESKIDYKGYFIVYSGGTSMRCKIVEPLSDTKIKERRQIMGPFIRCDRYGNKLYKKHSSIEEMLQKAKSYIDNHIVKWSESKNNPNNK